MEWILNQYQNYKSPDQPRQDVAVDFLCCPSAKGFVVHFDPLRWNRSDFMCLFDYLRDQTLELGYRKYVSDGKTYYRGEVVESIQRHLRHGAKQSCGEP